MKKILGVIFVVLPVMVMAVDYSQPTQAATNPSLLENKSKGAQQNYQECKRRCISKVKRMDKEGDFRVLDTEVDSEGEEYKECLIECLPYKENNQEKSTAAAQPAYAYPDVEIY